MKYREGSDHPNWKGDHVGNSALHEWVRNHLPKPDRCERCNTNKPREVSNDGTYSRDLLGWEWLCRSCHLRKDGRDHAGEKNGGAKLTTDQIAAIRTEYDGRWGAFARLGRKYGVAGWTISLIIKGKTWSK